MALHIQSADGAIVRNWAAEKECSSEQALWKAILMRAIADAFTASDHQIRASEENKAGDFDPDVVRGEARRWLVADYGDYVADRDFVCLAAGVDVDDLVRMARRRLAELKATQPPASSVTDGDSHAKELTAAELDRRRRRRESQRRYQKRVKEAQAHGMTLEQYDEMKRNLILEKYENLEAERRAKWAQQAAE